MLVAGDSLPQGEQSTAAVLVVERLPACALVARGKRESTRCGRVISHWHPWECLGAVRSGRPRTKLRKCSGDSRQMRSDR